MRLNCPKCGAQYEVDDAVIPATGRDVQCSGCGHIWFQPSRQMLDLAHEQAQEEQSRIENWDLPELPPAEAAADPVSDEVRAPEPEMSEPVAVEGQAPQDADAPALDWTELLMPASPAAESAPAPEGATPPDVGPAPKAGAVPRRPLDETLLAILREEAEREAAARRAEGTALETQEEMNLDAGPAAAPPPPGPAAPPRPAARVTPQRPPLDFSDLSSEDEDLDRAADLTEGPEPPPRGGRARRQQLPDIEEINSSLRASADRVNDVAAQGATHSNAAGRGGFRFGFSLVMLVAALAMLLYAYAPRLAVAVPALSPLLDTYVALANAARFWLDEQLRAVITQVQSGTPKG